jgi:hypothetical protein
MFFPSWNELNRSGPVALFTGAAERVPLHRGGPQETQPGRVGKELGAIEPGKLAALVVVERGRPHRWRRMVKEAKDKANRLVLY